ncbi:MAG: lamin tail domain-containing protein, partial [bacterium]
MRFPNVGWTSVVLSLPLLASPVAAQVVINEVYPNPGSEFDGAEFIELRNKGAGAVNIGNWVVGGTEFDGTCAGEDLWQVPANTILPANGYIVFAKDNADT